MFYDKIAFRMMPDFGQGSTVLQDAYIEYRHNKAVNIRAGKYKPPIGLERLQADAETNSSSARCLPTWCPTATSASSVGGSVLNDTLSYQVGVFNGNVDNSTVDTRTPSDKRTTWPELFAEPFRNERQLHSGAWASGFPMAIGVQQGTATAANLPTL